MKKLGLKNFHDGLWAEMREEAGEGNE